MKVLISALIIFSFYATAKIKVENVKVEIMEKGKDPVTVTMPIWVVKAGSQITDAIKVDDKTVNMQQILTAIESAPKAGKIMTVKEKNKTVIISVE